MSELTTTRIADPAAANPLHERVARLREVDNGTNLGYLAFEYLCIAAVVVGTIALDELRASWGWSAWWSAPVFAVAVILMGGLQHRLAGLGHESSHYSLLRNKWANDLVGDALCMIPILATVHFYRLFHMAHHQYPNDPERDPDLVNLGPGKGVAEFPMGRWLIVLSRLFVPLTRPLMFAQYQWEYVYVNVLGKGNNIYMRRVEGGDASSAWPRVGTWIGLAYVGGIIVGQFALTRLGHADWLIPAGLGAGLVMAAGAYLLPEAWLFRSPFRQPYSARFATVLRLGIFTGALIMLGMLREATGGRSALYFYLLWLVPLVTTFPYFMFLRDTYQHTNADDGRLTNTRVFYTDPLTRWAVFVYGQDMHVPHHLYPTVPHHRLRELHALLKGENPDYARAVIECEGTFANDGKRPTILDVLSRPRGS